MICLLKIRNYIYQWLFDVWCVWYFHFAKIEIKLYLLFINFGFPNKRYL